MELKDNSQRANWILIAFYLMLVLTIAFIASNLMQYDMMQKVYTLEEVEANDLRQQIIALAYYLTFILCAVFFILWFRRAYYNLQAIGISTLHTDSWAAGSWFIPILNLYRPYQIMAEIWEQTQNRISNNPHESKVLIGLWWGGWVIGSIIDQISDRVGRPGTLEAIESSTLLVIVSECISLITLILIILIIRKVSSWEQILANSSRDIPLEDHLL